ncbi:MAG: FAD-dependent oxidoreductase [Clostridiales Family XIII bacterium]|jgi:formate dehydrogenase major subunit|nr:FAD-dependent oxidoreductase [Clostridiales Family XIII bacterium]
MEKYRLNIDGKEVLGLPGQTILDVARENGVDIPTFCFDERTEIYGACGICVVEVEGNPKMVKACATAIAPGMVIKTDTDRVMESRKTNLELLLSNHVGDCRPPCALACPAQTDCQGYVGLIANGRYEEAIALIKERIPLPGAIGRVCPHPCEDKCRRGLVEQPISIAWLKRFAADLDMAGEEPFMPEVAPDTGKSVAIIGGGPYGLSLAYFLRQRGHAVTIFEAMPKMGGMLRYGIPEYRLPKEVLDEEIELIEKMGVEMANGVKVGVDMDFDTIRGDFDAVCVGIGAWKSTGVGCKGEDADGVIGGIDLLRKVVRNGSISLGRNVAVVGGGNTAMDACRTAVRLGAEKVYNVYRRTKDEMPADLVEIEEAEEEGVIFKNLTNPLEIIKGDDGRAKQILLQVMELGEPDASGRRAPVPVEGKTELLDVDTVVLAIGQAVDPAGFEGLELTRKKGLAYDPETFMTSIPGVFAGGDCGNDRISIAVEAIADALKSSDIVDAYLAGEDIKYEKPYFVERDDVTEKTFEDRERLFKSKMGHLSPEERKDNFTEVVFGFEEDDAVNEGDRCLECGCGDFFECKLIDYANQYDVKPSRLAGEKNGTDFEDDHPFIVRDPNKCILCGLCARVCDEVMGVGALGLVDRGFDTVVKPTLEKPLAESGCVSCGQCVSVCPTGALQERLSIVKSVPLDAEATDTTCPYCSVGCSLQLMTYGDLLLKAVPDTEGAVNKGLLCGKGKFGFDCAELEGKLLEPMIRKNGRLAESDWHEALVLTAKKAQAAAAKHGKGAVAVAVSDRYTNEEAYAVKCLAEAMGARILSFNNRRSGLAPVLGFDASPNTIDELLSTEVILAAAFSRADNPVIWLKLKQAAERGAKVVALTTGGSDKKMDFAFKTVRAGDDLSFLRELAAGLIAAGKVSPGAAGAEGYDAFAADLAGVAVGAEAAEVAALYGGAKKAMIVFQQNLVSVEAATLLADIAVLSGHIGSPRDGILQVKSKNNSQGLVDLGIRDGAEAMEGVKALLLFGEDPEYDLSGLDFLMVCDTHLTAAARRADVVMPGTGFASADGTYTNTERRLQQVRSAAPEDVLFANWEVAAEIARVYEVEFPWEDTADISEEMDDNLVKYRYAEPGEVFGGALASEKPALVAVPGGAFTDRLPLTDNLMKVIIDRLPSVVEQATS